jgi:hypothetical protein
MLVMQSSTSIYFIRHDTRTTHKVKYENSACNVLRLPKTKTHQNMAIVNQQLQRKICEKPSGTNEKKNLQNAGTKDDLEEGTP